MREFSLKMNVLRCLWIVLKDLLSEKKKLKTSNTNCSNLRFWYPNTWVVPFIGSSTRLSLSYTSEKLCFVATDNKCTFCINCCNLQFYCPNTWIVHSILSSNLQVLLSPKCISDRSCSVATDDKCSLAKVASYQTLLN